MKRDQGTKRHRETERGRVQRVRAIFPVLCVLLAIAGTVALAPDGYAGQRKPTEYEIKAAYLYNFGKFVTWPDSSREVKSAAFTICVLGHDPFGAALDSTLAGQTVNGKNVAIERIENLEGEHDCRILFISSSKDKELKQVLSQLARAGILTVSDIPDFSQRGGMIQFVLEGDRVRFEVNLTPVENAGLALSSELLKVAATVRRDARPGD